MRMRTRLFLLFAFAAVTVLTNAASAGNIAHGVEVVVIDPGPVSYTHLTLPTKLEV